MQTVFIRHNLNSSRKTLEYLWKKRLIAIHFNAICSVNPNDYDTAGKKALNRLWRYCESGALVGATYRSIKPNQMIVGEIKGGSKVEVLEITKNPDYDDYIYKVVELKNTKIISYIDYPLLAAIQPQGTITGWPSAEKYLHAILKKDMVNLDISSLHPSQLEVLCYEYLKFKNMIKVLLLPIGRGLMDIDIYGLNAKGKTVLAQVTYSTNPKTIIEKFDRLKGYKNGNAEFIFFGPESMRIMDKSINYIPIESVFKTLISNKVNPIYRKLIMRMLNQV